MSHDDSVMPVRLWTTLLPIVYVKDQNL